MTYWIRKFFSDPEAHGSALFEVLVVVGFLIAPFFYAHLMNFDADTTAINDGLLARGQIFALIYALSGTILYLSFGSKPSNGPKKMIGFVALFMLLPVFFMSGFDPTFESFIDPRANKFGYYGFAAFVIFYYLLLFYETLEPPNVGKSLDDGAKDMAEKARKFEE